MNRKQMKVHCYAEGRPGQWEGFCMEFDLAVQGKSLDEVRMKLQDQIILHLESAHELPEGDRIRMLNRSAPLAFQLGLWWRFVSTMWNRKNDGKQRAAYDCPLDGAAFAT